MGYINIIACLRHVIIRSISILSPNFGNRIASYMSFSSYMEWINFCYWILIAQDKYNLNDSQNFHRVVAESRSVISADEVHFIAPITRMDKLACVGLNYSGHCKEQGVEPPTCPVIFSKFPSNIVGPTDDVVLPSISDVNSFFKYFSSINPF